jgi:hypothetical protein
MAKSTSIIFPPRYDGRVVVFMRNEITGAEDVKLYKTTAAAKAAVTRFEKRMARIYG